MALQTPKTPSRALSQIAKEVQPSPLGGMDSVRFRNKFEAADIAHQALGILLVGDVNVHSKRWLYRSSHNSNEGEQIEIFA